MKVTLVLVLLAGKQLLSSVRRDVFAQSGKESKLNMGTPVVLRAIATITIHSMFMKIPVATCQEQCGISYTIIAHNLPCPLLGCIHTRRL